MAPFKGLENVPDDSFEVPRAIEHVHFLEM